jgi:hypothetical protein
MMMNPMDMLTTILSFAHQAIENDDSWDALYAETLAKHPDEMPPKDELRTELHTVIDVTMHAMTDAGMKLGLDAAPSEPAADYDYSRMYL